MEPVSLRQHHHWHEMHPAQVAQHWGVDTGLGLSEEEAAQRLGAHGANRPSSRPEQGAFKRWLAQLRQPLVLVLLVAAVVTALLGEWLDASVISAVVLVNALVGFIQEGKAQAALAALARAVAADATVLRAGSRRRLDAAQLVPGDVVLLAAGDKVPADLRVLGAKQLRTAEAALTGESTPMDKHHLPLQLDTLLADRRNMAYAGTLVLGGQATGLVVATGDATEVGRISGLMASTPELATPLTRKINAFSRKLLLAIGALAVLTFAMGLWRGESAFDMFMAAVALAIGAIPEGLPAAMTVTLAIGVGRMAQRRAIIRKLPAVETLGSTTVICSDKTGTLTENAMTVREVWAGGARLRVTGQGYGPEGAMEEVDENGDPHLAQSQHSPSSAWAQLCLAGMLCNDARLVQQHGQWQVLGDPTEAALLVLGRKAGLDEAALAQQHPRLDELGFDAAFQYMATLHPGQVFIKGALEKVLPMCAHLLDAQGRTHPLTAQAVQDLHAQASRMAALGLRVLALARSPHSSAEPLSHERMGHSGVWLGLVGMMDPPRPRAMAAVKACHAAGIRVKMITGDHPGTALAIGRQLGLVQGQPAVMTGRELAGLDEPALARAVQQCHVFARVEPEQKLRLVRALQAAGEVVAMTGDGVNDAPALKQADIGIAMGLGGTEVAKETADMVLTDDNFASIEAAVEEGRGIFDNLVKFIAWTLPTNAGEGLVILTAIVLGTTLPIAPLQILWINMTTAIFLGMMLAFEPPEPGLMQRPPRPPGAPLLDRVLLQRTVLVSLCLLVSAFGLFELALQKGRSVAEARTLATNLFVMVELVYLFNCRSLSGAFWSNRFNPWVWVGSAVMLDLQMAFTYAPAFNRTFQSAPLGWGDWGLIAALALACGMMVELEKGWRRAVKRRGLKAASSA
jgi:cation-transporting P-type ATPase F